MILIEIGPGSDPDVRGSFACIFDGDMNKRIALVTVYINFCINTMMIVKTNSLIK